MICPRCCEPLSEDEVFDLLGKVLERRAALCEHDWVWVTVDGGYMKRVCESCGTPQAKVFKPF